MKNQFSLSPLLPVLLAAATFLSACASSPPSRFYTLTPVSSSTANELSAKGGSNVSINVTPVEIPDYLERPGIATRVGNNELKVAQFERWAGSLSDNMTAVLADNLGTLVGTDHVSATPGQGGEADYSVVMRVLQLDCVPGDQVRLKAQWTIYSGPDSEEIATHIQSFSEKLPDVRYDSLAGAVSKNLEKVSREIAREISAAR